MGCGSSSEAGGQRLQQGGGRGGQGQRQPPGRGGAGGGQRGPSGPPGPARGVNGNGPNGGAAGQTKGYTPMEAMSLAQAVKAGARVCPGSIHVLEKQPHYLQSRDGLYCSSCWDGILNGTSELKCQNFKPGTLAHAIKFNSEFIHEPSDMRLTNWEYGHANFCNVACRGSCWENTSMLQKRIPRDFMHVDLSKRMTNASKNQLSSHKREQVKKAAKIGLEVAQIGAEVYMEHQDMKNGRRPCQGYAPSRPRPDGRPLPSKQQGGGLRPPPSTAAPGGRSRSNTVESGYASATSSSSRPGTRPTTPASQNGRSTPGNPNTMPLRKPVPVYDGNGAGRAPPRDQGRPGPGSRGPPQAARRGGPPRHR